MRRLFAWTLTLWYALMASGVYLHVHYCCGNVLDISLNPTHAVCATNEPADACTYTSESHHTQEHTCCSSSGCHSDTDHHQASHTLSKACCSTDDFYIAIEDAHDKSAFSLDFPSAQAELLSPVHRPIEPTQSAKPHRIDARAGPPLYLLFVSRIDYA